MLQKNKISNFLFEYIIFGKAAFPASLLQSFHDFLVADIDYMALLKKKNIYNFLLV